MWLNDYVFGVLQLICMLKWCNLNFSILWAKVSHKIDFTDKFKASLDPASGTISDLLVLHELSNSQRTTSQTPSDIVCFISTAVYTKR